MWTDSLEKWMVHILDAVDSPAGSKDLDTATVFLEALEEYPVDCHLWIAKSLRETLEAEETRLHFGSDPSSQKQTLVRRSVGYFCGMVAQLGIKAVVEEAVALIYDEEWDRAEVRSQFGLSLSPLMHFCTRGERDPIFIWVSQAANMHSLAIAKTDPSNPGVLRSIEASEIWLADARESAIVMEDSGLPKRS